MNDIIEKQLWQNTLTKLKAKCKLDDVPFSLTIGDVINVLDNKCAYTGQLLFRKNGSGSGWQPNTPTLTMVDSKMGFVPGNIAVVSNLTATLLNTLSVEQLSNLVKSISPPVADVPVMQQLDDALTRVFATANSKQCNELMDQITEVTELKYTQRKQIIKNLVQIKT